MFFAASLQLAEEKIGQAAAGGERARGCAGGLPHRQPPRWEPLKSCLLPSRCRTSVTLRNGSGRTLSFAADFVRIILLAHSDHARATSIFWRDDIGDCSSCSPPLPLSDRAS